MKLQRLGGYAIFACWIAFIAYVALASTIRMEPITAKTMAALSSSRNELNLCALLFLISFVLYLVPNVALHERMRADAPCLTRLMLIASSSATVMAIIQSMVCLKSFGLILAQDISAFKACLTVANGLYLTLNHACGWSCLFLGCAVLKTRAFPRTVGVINLLAGIVWMPSPFIVQYGFSFIGPIIYALSGIGSIWIGIEMIRQKEFQPKSQVMMASR